LTGSRILRLALNCPELVALKKCFQSGGDSIINPEETSLNPETEAPEKEQTKPDIRREFLELIRLVVIFLFIFWGVKTFVVEGYEVQGESMMPTLADKDRILVFKLPQHLHKFPLLRRFQPFQEKDILVLEGFGHKRLIKRLIAYNPRQHPEKVNAQSADDHTFSPDTVKVEYDLGIVRINNWQIDESAYLFQGGERTRDTDLCLLEPGELYVLGDHRAVSKDSRSFHAVRDSQVVGKAFFRFWPLSKIGLL
jgi:signal peptidase I